VPISKSGSLKHIAPPPYNKNPPRGAKKVENISCGGNLSGLDLAGRGSFGTAPARYAAIPNCGQRGDAFSPVHAGPCPRAPTLPASSQRPPLAGGRRPPRRAVSAQHDPAYNGPVRFQQKDFAVPPPAAPRLASPATGYEIADFHRIEPVACPCGQARRAFGDVEDFLGTIHVTEISADARTHYHRRLTETYYFLECAF
jgi:hypothetical protein